MKSKCKHLWKEVQQKINGKEIELRLICEKCGFTMVEIYSIDKTYMLDKKGCVVGEVKLYKQEVQDDEKAGGFINS